MGTEYSVHNDYELEDSIPSPNETWEMFSGQKKTTKAKVTVFVHEKSKQEKKKKSKPSNQKVKDDANRGFIKLWNRTQEGI